MPNEAISAQGSCNQRDGGTWTLPCALGNLTQVTEQDPSLGQVQTNYTYNLRNQLIQSQMPRNGTTQTRSFNYDLATGRLSSAANPENGTVSYTYNADATPATKTDARNQQVQYSYDSFRRVTQIRRYPVSGGAEDLCQRTDFTYDGGVNGWGRLTSTSWGGVSCTGGAWSQSYDYTQAGLSRSPTAMPHHPSTMPRTCSTTPPARSPR